MKHGDLDDDQLCILSQLEPAFCGGCRDKAKQWGASFTDLITEPVSRLVGRVSVPWASHDS